MDRKDIVYDGVEVTELAKNRN